MVTNKSLSVQLKCSNTLGYIKSSKDVADINAIKNSVYPIREILFKILHFNIQKWNKSTIFFDLFDAKG